MSICEEYISESVYKLEVTGNILDYSKGTISLGYTQPSNARLVLSNVFGRNVQTFVIPTVHYSGSSLIQTVLLSS